MHDVNNYIYIYTHMCTQKAHTHLVPRPRQGFLDVRKKAAGGTFGTDPRLVHEGGMASEGHQAGAAFEVPSLGSPIQRRREDGPAAARLSPFSLSVSFVLARLCALCQNASCSKNQEEVLQYFCLLKTGLGISTISRKRVGSCARPPPKEKNTKQKVFLVPLTNPKRVSSVNNQNTKTHTHTQFWGSAKVRQVGYNYGPESASFPWLFWTSPFQATVSSVEVMCSGKPKHPRVRRQ